MRTRPKACVKMKLIRRMWRSLYISDLLVSKEEYEDATENFGEGKTYIEKVKFVAAV